MISPICCVWGEAYDLALFSVIEAAAFDFLDRMTVFLTLSIFEGI